MKLTLILLPLLFIGCNELEQGDVVAKRFEPQRQYMAFFPLIISNGKSTSVIMIPYMVTDYEDWVVTITGIADGDTLTEEVYVSREKYECLYVGDHMIVDSGCVKTDNNNVKVRK